MQYKRWLTVRMYTKNIYLSHPGTLLSLDFFQGVCLLCNPQKILIHAPGQVLNKCARNRCCCYPESASSMFYVVYPSELVLVRVLMDEIWVECFVVSDGDRAVRHRCAAFEIQSGVGREIPEALRSAGNAKMGGMCDLSSLEKI